MHWIKAALGIGRSAPPRDEREAFRRREAELRERYERLERLAIESDVISRSDRPEGLPWDAR